MVADRTMGVMTYRGDGVEKSAAGSVQKDDVRVGCCLWHVTVSALRRGFGKARPYTAISGGPFLLACLISAWSFTITGLSL